MKKDVEIRFQHFSNGDFFTELLLRDKVIKKWNFKYSNMYLKDIKKYLTDKELSRISQFLRMVDMEHKELLKALELIEK